MPAPVATNNNVSGSQAPASNSLKTKKDKLAALAALQWEIEEDEQWEEEEQKRVAEEERKRVAAEEKAKLEAAKWAQATEAKNYEKQKS